MTSAIADPTYESIRNGKEDPPVVRLCEAGDLSSMLRGEDWCTGQLGEESVGGGGDTHRGRVEVAVASNLCLDIVGVDRNAKQLRRHETGEGRFPRPIWSGKHPDSPH